MLNQGLVTERFVGTLAAYFLAADIVTIGAYSSMGMVTTDLLTEVAILLPALWLGSYVGIKLLPRVNAILFKWIALAVVFASAVVIMVSVLIEL